jgi:hypothetical protein
MSLGAVSNDFQNHYWERRNLEEGLDIDWDEIDSAAVRYSGPEENILDGELVAEDVDGDECRRLLEEFEPETYDEFENYSVMRDRDGEIVKIHVYSEERYGPFNLFSSDRESLWIQNIE